MPAGDDLLAGMDPEGLRRTLGELLAANRAMQANFDEIRQQFPIQPSHLADDIPTWGELEEGGLEPPEEGGSFEEQLGGEGGGFEDLIWVEVKANGDILRGGAGLIVERFAEGRYRIWLQGSNDFEYPGALRTLSPSTAGAQAVNGNINLITSEKGVKGYEIVLVENVADTTYVDANFHFSATNLTAEVE